MSVKANYSRGYLHAQAIKQSPRWHQWCESRQLSPATRAERAREAKPDHESNWLALAKKAWGDLVTFRDLTRLSTYSDEAIQQQLREHWLAGYVAALRDVKEERERIEQASYEQSTGRISIQEAAAISHKFDKEWKK